jgi:MFS family permease
MTALTHSLRRGRSAAVRDTDRGAERNYKRWVGVFMLVVIAHWVEHIVQAIQIFALGWPRPQARGLLGEWWPWLIKEETLHYGFAVVMLIGLIWLLPGFSGEARKWWIAALVLQVWHHMEHLLLLIQALTHPFFGQKVPTSVIQLVFPRVELHLFYNAVVFTPMLIAVYLQFYDRRGKSRARAATSSAGS